MRKLNRFEAYKVMQKIEELADEDKFLPAGPKHIAAQISEELGVPVYRTTIAHYCKGLGIKYPRQKGKNALIAEACEQIAIAYGHDEEIEYSGDGDAHYRDLVSENIKTAYLNLREAGLID